MKLFSYVKYSEEEQNIEEVVKSYVPAIKRIINQIGLEESEDLIQEGLLSVIESLEKGETISSIICTRIAQDICQYLKSSFAFSGINPITRTVGTMKTIMSSTKPEDMEEVNFSYENRRASEYILVNMLPYLRDSQYDNTEDTVEEIALRNYEKSRLIELLELLSPRERIVMIKLYGLLGENAMTREALASYLHISPGRVSQIHNHARYRLKRYMKLSELEAREMVEEKNKNYRK